MEVGNQILKFRKNLGMSQSDLADIVGVSRQTVSNWESSKYSPDIVSLNELSKVFNISVDQLINGELSRPKLVTINRDDQVLARELKKLTVKFIMIYVNAVISILFESNLFLVFCTISVFDTAVCYYKIWKIKRKYNLKSTDSVLKFSQNEDNPYFDPSNFHDKHLDHTQMTPSKFVFTVVIIIVTAMLTIRLFQVVPLNMIVPYV